MITNVILTHINFDLSDNLHRNVKEIYRNLFKQCLDNKIVGIKTDTNDFDLLAKGLEDVIIGT